MSSLLPVTEEIINPAMSEITRPVNELIANQDEANTCETNQNVCVIQSFFSSIILQRCLDYSRRNSYSFVLNSQFNM